MNKIVLSNISGKDEISEIIKAFNEDKTKNIQQNKDQSAGKLTTYKKSDLETGKANIEYYIDNTRTFAAFSAIFGLLLSKAISQWLPINFMSAGESLVGLSYLLSALLLIRVGKKVSWLPVIKLALARKSDK